MRKLLLSLSIGILSIVFLLLYAAPILFQEGNPAPLLTAIMKLEKTDEGYIQYTETEMKKKYISKNNRENRYQVVKEVLEAKGWSYEEQAGSGLIFEKGNNELIVDTKLYSSYYYLWSLPKEI
ncbi:hypothetical protein [Pseudalkalibacillus salsuginis]|uniref:hypothetical protein n=1 Tax=Pseudalkalibacillus salsuginis TaxID=2910972 RepID=UPI001F290CFC|nr:hypothetical protein [Pseudalkalibacillus salsuginis]MCF6409363.1 hypothetical protein [Pseudalkalibacillus salsuginis]